MYQLLGGFGPRPRCWPDFRWPHCEYVLPLFSPCVRHTDMIVVWGFVYATLATYCTTLSHGEMFAVYPTAGGQYHWAYMVSSPRYRASVSWFTGMLNVIGLWLGIATAAYLCANMVVSIILVNNPGFTNTPATQYGIFVAMTLFAPLSMICVGNRANRMLEYVLMALSCVGALVIAITLLATQTPKASAVSSSRRLPSSS